MSTAVPDGIDEDAPVVAEHHVHIGAAPEAVWAVHVDVDGWSRWNPDIRASSTPEPLRPGVTFTWETGPLSVPSTVYRVDEPRRILWGGVSSEITGMHEWRFDPAHGGTEVVTRESWAGEPVTRDAATAQRMLDRSLESWLRSLAAEVERRSAPRA